MGLTQITKNIYLPEGLSLHIICTFPPPTEEFRILWSFGNKDHGIKAYLDSQQNLGLIYFEGEYKEEVKHSNAYKNIKIQNIDDSPQHVGCQILKDGKYILQLYFNGELVTQANLDRYEPNFEEKLQLGSDFDGSHHIGKMYLRRTTFWPSAINPKIIKDFYDGKI